MAVHNDRRGGLADPRAGRATLEISSGGAIWQVAATDRRGFRLGPRRHDEPSRRSLFRASEVAIHIVGSTTPGRDLAKNLPGYGLLREASRRRRDGEADLSWRVGADGEDIVASTLRALTHPRRPLWPLFKAAPTARWRVLHGVQVGPAAVADLDHVLVGPPGIVVINTKHLDPRHRITIRAGEIYRGRIKTDFVEKAARGSTANLLAHPLRSRRRPHPPHP